MLIHRIGKQKTEHRMPNNPKPTLEMQHLPFFRVHYKAFERYVQIVFGFELDYLLAAGVVEGCGVDYPVTGVLDTTAWQQQAEELRKGKRTKNVHLILNVLAHDDYIPCGKYTIHTHRPPDPTVIYTQLLRQHQNALHPECMRFKNEHRDNATFMKRAAELERSLAEQTK